MTKIYEVTIRIPSYVEKTIYVDDVTNKKDAKTKALEDCIYNSHDYDASGDHELGQFYRKAKVVSVEGARSVYAADIDGDGDVEGGK